MENKEVNITYETLYDLLKKERDIADLQKLDPNFFAHFVEYLNEKKRMLDKEDSLFSDDEKKKTEKQIDNAKRLIKEIYERREKKILNIALMKSRTKSNVIDMSSLLENEKKLLNDVEGVLNSFRKEVIDNIINGRPASKVIAREPVKKDEESGQIMAVGQKINLDDSGNDSILMEAKATRLVRFLCPVPKFVGTELEEYGPFGEEDIANLPSEIAEVLITKGRAEEIEEN